MMKNIKNILAILVLAVISFSCVDEDTVNQERPGTDVEPSLSVVVLNQQGEPVSGATVDFFASAEDYALEQNAVKTAETNAQGVVTLLPGDVDSERADYFFSASSGSLRNWSSNVNSGYLYWSSGETVIETTLAPVLPEFLAILGDYNLTSYTYPGNGNIIGFAPECELDDVFTFRKDGLVIRAEGTDVCAEPSEFQSPVSEDGSVWSNWALNEDGTEIDIRDLDPFYDADATAGLEVDATTVTIDYGGGYVATLTRI
ncbi:hypothetical protein [Marivirga sp.]|uniref:hypothetical protein n=1 Tax=Marivirga sp. TaxID=2018662 RepID=UPI0025F0E915|nr:hypothetical protein [Marivirga sp.]